MDTTYRIRPISDHINISKLSAVTRFLLLFMFVGSMLLIGSAAIHVGDVAPLLQLQQNKTIRIQGTIEGATDQRLLVAMTNYLSRSEDIAIDTIRLVDGRFDFLLKPEDKIGFFALTLEDDPRNRFLFVASQGDELVYQGILKHFSFDRISGSSQDSIFRSFQQMRADYVSRINSYGDSSRNTQDVVKKAYYKEMNNLVYNQYSDAVIQFMIDHPRAYSPLILFKSNVFDRVGKDSSTIIYNMLSPDVINTLLGRDADKLLSLFPDQSSLNGISFPWGDLRDVDGRAFVRNEHKGKTLVVLWASWCGPCRQEIPQLREIYDKAYPNLSLISISLDVQPDAWKIALDKEQMPWAQYWAPGGFRSTLAYSLGISSIPQIFLLDENDYIIDQWQHIEEYQQEK